MQKKFEHLSDDVLQDEGGVMAIIEILDQLSGEREGDDVRRAVREAISTTAGGPTRRSPPSSCAETQFQKAASHGLEIPSAVRGVLLEEGANLSSQGEQYLRTLARAVSPTRTCPSHFAP